MEILFRITDKSRTEPAGDVIEVRPDGSNWSKDECENPAWRIIRSPILGTHHSVLMSTSRRLNQFDELYHKAWGLDLSKLPAVPREGIVDLPREIVEQATYKRPNRLGSLPLPTEEVEAPIEVPMSQAVTFSMTTLLAAKFAEKAELLPTSRRKFFKSIAAGLMALAFTVQPLLAGTITKTIGTTGRDYSTVALWIASLPANLVTDGNSYVGQCFNDSEFLTTADSTQVAAFGAHTTDSTHTITLTTGTGQSFQDAAGVRSNALVYNISNGVGFRSTGHYTNVIELTGTNNFLTISKIQIKVDTNSRRAVFDGGSDNCIYKDLVCQKVTTEAFPVFRVSGSSTIVANVLVIQHATGQDGFRNGTGNVTYIGCTAVKPSNITAGGTGFARDYGTPLAESCASFGFTTSFDATNYSASSKNNASNTTIGVGSSNQASMTYNATTPFTQADATGSLDFRPVAATNLASNGFKDATNAPNDITGTTRAASPTIGVWELTSAAGPPAGQFPRVL